MQTLDMNGLSFTIGETVIDSIQVRELFFKPLIEMVARARRETDDDFQKALEFMRFREQVTYMSAGKPVALTDEALRQMPIKLARTIQKAYASFSRTPGKVITPDADGITKPVIYALGTPIPTDKGEITELEFFASTLGEIEDVIFKVSSNEQALALIEKVATPLGGEPGLQQLPSWGLDMITVVDGSVIAEKILPLFID